MKALKKNLKSTFGEKIWSNLSQVVALNSPVITIGGDQLTGKVCLPRFYMFSRASHTFNTKQTNKKQSTLSENIAKRFSGSCLSVGETLREEASRREISIAEMCKLAKEDLSIDLGVDMEMCRKICEGNLDGSPLIAQGRLPAVLATASQEFLGKPKGSIHRIYLKCSILEQTLRFMSREVGEEEYEMAKSAFQGVEFETLSEASEAVVSLPLQESSKDRILHEFQANQCRDDDDRERFAELYGAEFDYRDKSFYDIEIDTSNIPSEETFRIAFESIQKSSVLESYFFRVGQI